MPVRPHVIAVANQKGGSGKTTTCLNLGAALAEEGRRVLVLDLDPQFTATRASGVDPFQQEATIREVLFREAGLEEAIVSGNGSGLDVVPASLTLATADEELHNVPGGDLALRRALQHPVAGRYDFILVDCPPSLGKLVLTAITAARWLLIPVDSSPWSMVTIDQLFKLVERAQQFLEHDIRLLGIVLTRYQANVVVCQEIRRAARERWGEALFETTVRHSAKAIEAAMAGEDILRWGPRSPLAGDYRALAREVEERVAT